MAHEVGGAAYWFLAALLMIIEVAPVFFKMMIPRGPYLNLVDNQNELVNAKFGIVHQYTEVGNSSWGKTIVAEPRYLQAEALFSFQKGQIETEMELTEEARKMFNELHKKEINAHPEKYMILPEKDNQNTRT